MKRKLVAKALAVVLAATMLSACGNAAAPSATDPAPAAASAPTESALSGKIVFGTHRTDHAEGSLKELADQFMAEHPGTEIEIEAIKDAPQTVAPRLAAGEAPDIFFNFGIQPKDYARYVLPLDDLGYDEENAMVDRGPDGNVYWLTSAAAYDALVYNKAVFAELGIEAPKTLDEFYAACETIKAAGKIPFGSNFKDSWVMQYFETAYTPAKTGNGKWMVDLADADEFLPADGAILEGANILNTLKEAGYLEPDLTSTNWDQFKIDFAQGKIAMCYMGTWICPQMVDAGMNQVDVGVIPFPGTEYLDAGGDYGYGISKDSKNPELAKAFLKFLWEDSKFQVATGAISPLKGAKIDDPYVKALLDSGFPIAAVSPQPEKLTNIYAEMRFDWGTFNQEYLLSSDKAATIAEYNKKFADAKAIVEAG